MKTHSTTYLVIRSIARLLTVVTLAWLVLLGIQAFFVMLWSFA